MNDTFPKLLIHNANRFRDRPAIQEKKFGIWQTWTWVQMKQEIFSFANGLAALGFVPGDKLAIIGRNRPRLYWGIAAAQCLRGIPVPIYADSVVAEMRFVLDHAGVTYALVEDQEQVDKVLEIMPNCTSLKRIIFDDSRGLRDYDKSSLINFGLVQKSGLKFSNKNSGYLENEIRQGCGSDIAIILYTSGTTGDPKGVVLTNDNVRITASNSAEQDQLTEKEVMLSYLPMAWVGDHIFSYGQAYVTGMCINCPENEATVASDLREIGPTYYFAPPSIFENLLTTVMIRMDDAGGVMKKLFHYFMGIAHKTGIHILNGETVSIKDRIMYMLGNCLIYAPLKNTMGFGRIRIAYTAGEAIGPEVFDFFRSLGINIKQLYGQTEGAVFIAAHPDGEVYADTVGKPSLGVEVKITDDGEVTYRGPGVFHSYYRNSAATRQTKNPDGWVATGDAGYIDDRGHLKIIDRVEDVGKLKNGNLFAPKYIENKLKYSPKIKEAVVFGIDREFAAAFVNIELDVVGNWAERNNIAYASYQELAGHPRVNEMVLDTIQNVNQRLAMDAMVSDSQIQRFLILHKELDADDGELTRTRKVRRRIIVEKYDALIEALYSNVKTCNVKTEVTFEDGRKGSIEANIKILDVETFDAVKKAS